MLNATGWDAEARPAPPEGSVPSSPRSWAALIAIGLSLFQLVLLVLLVWPLVRVQPREVPIALAGPPSATAMIKKQIDASAPGAFKFREADGKAGARTLIENADVYGAIVIGQRGPEVLTATAASPAVAGVLNGVAAGMSQKRVPVEDVVKTTHDDPNKAGLTTSLLILLLLATAAGTLLAQKVRRASWRWAGLGLFVAVSAPLSAVLLNGWLGVFDSSFFKMTGVLAFGVLASALPVMGLVTLLGPAGGRLGGAVLSFLAPVATVIIPTGSEMLPKQLGTIIGLIPPGAAVDLIQSVSSFDGSRATGPVVVLLVWSAAGAAIAVTAPSLNRLRTRPGKQIGASSGEAPVPAA